MRRRYHILDVFTTTPHAGNPLAVVLDSAGLDASAMLTIAANFALSETVFVAPPRDPINTAALRIFTPTLELPFAGHPTIGTAILLAKMQAPELLASQDVGLVLEQGIGLVCCSVRHRRGEAAHARFEVPALAQAMPGVPAIDDLAALFGLPPAAIGFGTHRPSRFSIGPSFTFVPVSSLDALGQARLDPAPAGALPMGYFLYTPDAPQKPRAFRARMLAPGMGIAEDPATGSAAAAFASVLLAAERLPDGAHDCLILQGIEMGRPSRIGLAFAVEQGRVATAAIGGSAVMVAGGTLDL